MKTPLFTGSSVAIVTPMHADGSVNYEKLSQLIELQIQAEPPPSPSAAPPVNPQR